MTERTIIISAGSVEVAASLNESSTGSAIWHALPIEESANTWGDEIFFDIPVEADIDESAREVVELGLRKEVIPWVKKRGITLG